MELATAGLHSSLEHAWPAASVYRCAPIAEVGASASCAMRQMAVGGRTHKTNQSDRTRYRGHQIIASLGYRDSASPLSTIKLPWVSDTASPLPPSSNALVMAHLVPVPNLRFDADLEAACIAVSVSFSMRFGCVFVICGASNLTFRYDFVIFRFVL